MTQLMSDMLHSACRCLMRIQLPAEVDTSAPHDKLNEAYRTLVASLRFVSPFLNYLPREIIDLLDCHNSIFQGMTQRMSDMLQLVVA